MAAEACGQASVEDTENLDPVVHRSGSTIDLNGRRQAASTSLDVTSVTRHRRRIRALVRQFWTELITIGLGVALLVHPTASRLGSGLAAGILLTSTVWHVALEVAAHGIDGGP